MKTIFEKSRPGRSGVDIEGVRTNIPAKYLRGTLNLPEISEVDVVRHYTELSRRNFGVDNGFYPLGSCTMKYNPKINEDTARLEGFNQHPLAPIDCVQGNLQLIYELQEYLCEITGMDAYTCQPAAGAHGELTSVMIIKKHFKGSRTKILIPDSAHGTNPASASHCGFETVEIKSNKKGDIDIDDLKSKLDKEVAAVMITYPNTLGLFDKNIVKISELIHDNGSLLYMDGANLNAIMGKVKPGKIGVDLIQLNLHKTFATPHGCGGPGSGPVGVTKELEKYLPTPIVRFENKYHLDYSAPHSIGRVKPFYGNFGVMIKAYTYIRALGPDLKLASETAVLNANYLKDKLKKVFGLPYDRECAHEFVLSDKDLPNGVTTNHIAKRLLDYGIHSPTVYFPLIVHGAIMIEPTETESKETLDHFVAVMKKIRAECDTDPEKVKNAPHNLFVGELDALKAVKELDVKWESS